MNIKIKGIIIILNGGKIKYLIIILIKVVYFLNLELLKWFIKYLLVKKFVYKISIVSNVIDI